jgi:hypothetical protein
MPKHYRIPIPLNDEARHAFKELAEATNTSIGAAAGGFLNELAPAVLKLAQAYKLAKADPIRAAEMVTQQAVEAGKALDQEQLDLIEAIEKAKTKGTRA